MRFILGLGKEVIEIVRSGIGIVTDSTVYLNKEMLKEYSIAVVPLMVNLGNLSFPEGEITNSEFYRLLRESGTMSTTSQPSPGEFVKTYEDLGKSYASIISIHISGQLSGTVSSAGIVKGMLPHLDIEIFDSYSTSIGLSFQVLEAARAARAGLSKSTILERLQWMRDNTQLFFIVGTLDYLRRGGRIGGAQAVLGSYLEIKPILHLVEGRIELFERVRTRPRAITRMLEFLKKEVLKKGLGGLAVLHVDAPQEGIKLAESLRREYPGFEVPVFEVGPVIGAHVGPDTLGLAFYPILPGDIG
jgi:DegV family protein with EDD domain